MEEGRKGSGAASGASGKRPLACLPCSRAKVACDYGIPCTRCFKHCLSCVQVVPKGRPQKGSGGGGGGSGGQNGEGSGPGPVKQRRRRTKVTEAPTLDATPIVELSIARTDPGVTAGVFIESFFRTLATGKILRDNVVALMRTWRLWNLAAGTDLSWGALDAMSEALGITPVELESPKEVVFDVPPDERQRRAKIFMMGLRSAAGGPLSQVADGLPYSHADEIVPTLVTVFKACSTSGSTTPVPAPAAASTSASASASASASGGEEDALARFRQWSNPACAQMVKSVTEIQGDIMRYRMLQFFLLMGLFDPADRPVLSDHYHQSFFTDTRQTTCFVKASLSDGQVRLYIQRCRRIPLPGGRVAVLHQIEPCPKSRHMTDRPESSHAVLRKFRSSKANDGVLHPTEIGLPPLPAAPPAAVAWAEGRPDAIATDAAATATAAAALGPVAFPALAGLPGVPPALGREVEAAATKALVWKSGGYPAVAAMGGGRGGGGSAGTGPGLPDIFRAPPPGPLAPPPVPPPLLDDEDNEGEPPPPATKKKRARRAAPPPPPRAGGSWTATAASSLTSSGGNGGGSSHDGALKPERPFSPSHVASSSSPSFASLAPAPFPAQPPPTPLQAGMDATFVLGPDGVRSPVPVFDGEAELLSLALFKDEDEGEA